MSNDKPQTTKSKYSPEAREAADKIVRIFGQFVSTHMNQYFAETFKKQSTRHLQMGCQSWGLH